LTVRGKLLLAGCAFSLLSSILVGFTAESLYSRRLRQEVARRLRADAELVVAVLEAEPPSDRLAKRYGRALGCRVTFIDPEGWVVGDSAVSVAELPGLENHGGREEVSEARRSGSGEAIRLSATVGRSMFYVARALDWPNGGRGFVRLAFPLSRIEALEQEHRNLLIVTVLGLTLCLTGIAYLFAWRAARPIEEMRESALAICAGEEVPLVLNRRDEIGDLGRACESMRQRLSEQIRALAEDRNLFSSVLASMKEAVLVIDREQRTLLINDAAQDLLALPVAQARERALVEAVRDPEILSCFRRVLDGETVKEILRKKGTRQRAYELQALPFYSPSGEPSGAVGVFFDVTRLEALEGVRREFVANVSHELRTPLTAIRAFIETLLDETGEGPVEAVPRRDFLEIVARHANRMERLIDDLTDLSLIETGAISLTPAPVEIGARVEEILRTLRPRLERAGIDARNEIPSGFTVDFDPRRLDQVLWNLLDNALKFNRPGGSIVVRGSETDAGRVVTVSDTGIGIAKSDREKVFNRFYRADTVKSRELGGTGLGLSIVKHLMRLHGGTVEVQSELGRGSSFTLRFPASGSPREQPVLSHRTTRGAASDLS
jgi:two-component system phosphate regulon sensor histidine kinase PhoR